MKRAPRHMGDESAERPTDPCAACGQTRWRIWDDEEHQIWWICATCHPLTVTGPLDMVVRYDDGAEDHYVAEIAEDTDDDVPEFLR